MDLTQAIQKIKEQYKDNPQRVQEERAVIGKYGEMFNPQILDRLTKEDFKSFLLIKNNKHWDAIHRHGNIITQDMGRLRNAIKIVLDESKPLKERLDILLPHYKPSYIKGLGKAVLTPILFVSFPDRYCVFNNIVEKGMEGFDVFPKLKNKSFAEKYLKINEICNNIAKENDISLWRLDEVWYYGLKGKKIGEEEETETEEEKEDVADFGLESHLEDFLVGNWEKIPQFKDLDILQEDGELIGQQFNTKDVGIIDILCKNKKTGDFVIIELKKGREGDKVVGQALRYITWVKKNLAKEGQKVNAIVITKEEDTKLGYAIESVSNLIDLKFYEATFTLKDKK